MSQRSRTLTKTTRKLKRCERGAACQFKHEHQHTSEYSHEDEPKSKPPAVGAGRKLGGRKLPPPPGGRRQVMTDAINKRLKSSIIDLTKD
ncbi:hypothetical protein BASA81_001144 [Batrachochytrium salamandrivorans]|nr:hypothetical protein BASA81_001144 [Batrachochytrium salamandrivorans]